MNIKIKEALDFFEDNYIMISSLESKQENGCAEKCLEILRNAVKLGENESKYSIVKQIEAIMEDDNIRFVDQAVRRSVRIVNESL